MGAARTQQPPLICFKGPAGTALGNGNVWAAGAAHLAHCQWPGRGCQKCAEALTTMHYPFSHRCKVQLTDEPVDLIGICCILLLLHKVYTILLYSFCKGRRWYGNHIAAVCFGCLLLFAFGSLLLLLLSARSPWSRKI